VDLWRAPVLPWLAPAADNAWLPKRFGLRVGQEYFVLPAEHAAQLLERLDAGAAAGARTVPVEGLLEPLEPGSAAPKELPVNDQVRSAVEALRPFAGGDGPGPGVAEPPTPFEPPPSPGGKLFLIVRENLEEVEFAPFAPVGVPTPQAKGPVRPPARLKTALKPHQQKGLDWLDRSRSAAPAPFWPTTWAWARRCRPSP
jgi:hypothetical protein